jgi:hypothetical protein
MRRVCMTNQGQGKGGEGRHKLKLVFRHSFLFLLLTSTLILSPSSALPTLFTSSRLSLYPFIYTHPRHTLFLIVCLFVFPMSTTVYSAVPSDENGRPAHHRTKPHYPHQDLPQFTVNSTRLPRSWDHKRCIEQQAPNPKRFPRKK